ncbi:MAG: antitoxin [Anaerolineae bacterium]|uniref:ribonuclease toxin HepT-like protein n=1 Tax=Thermoflexus sp. TaxID=1969742 RepID=UPI0025F55EFE|nr:hypothetical protein [Thermoflexus sp.]MCS7352134.1 hypothetical protein [Thermoflexus sp.]MDW8181593.1 antitoxin [Anaerolineae bacterium]
MSQIPRTLAQRIRGELRDLERVVHRAMQIWEKSAQFPEETAYVEAVALNLHSFYSGVERVFELIARNIDNWHPQGEAWHRELLARMAESLPQARPAVISSQNAQLLDEFRKFRHLIRNVYVFHLDPAKMKPLIQQLPTLWSGLHAELAAFADFLEQL